MSMIPRIHDLFIGIDPGKSGGIAVLGHALRMPRVYAIPTTPKDIYSIFQLWTGPINPSGHRINCHALLEWANPGFFGSSKSSVAKLYGSFTELRMVLACLEIPFAEIKPRAWQKQLGIQGHKKTESQRQWKERLRANAQNMFPRMSLWDDTKGKQLAVADALLIAHCCRQMYK